jgi:hypothetical protein
LEMITPEVVRELREVACAFLDRLGRQPEIAGGPAVGLPPGFELVEGEPQPADLVCVGTKWFSCEGGAPSGAPYVGVQKHWIPARHLIAVGCPLARRIPESEPEPEPWSAEDTAGRTLEGKCRINVEVPRLGRYRITEVRE